MKTMLLATLASVLIATQAHALSCLRPDVARTFQWVSAADEDYVVLLGAFDFNPPSTNTERRAVPQERRFAARFTGQSLGASGFQDNEPLDVTVVFSCLSAWCGSMSPDAGQVLAFVERSSSGYELTIGPCLDTVFTRVTPIQIEQVEACMRGEACTEAPTR